MGDFLLTTLKWCEISTADFYASMMLLFLDNIMGEVFQHFKMRKVEEIQEIVSYDDLECSIRLLANKYV